MERLLAMGEAMAAELDLDERERAVAHRIAALPEIEPPTGWEDRAAERFRRERGDVVEAAVTCAACTRGHRRLARPCHVIGCECWCNR